MADKQSTSKKVSPKITELGTHRKKTASKPKVFVIDTNVLIHNPNSLLNFEEHQIILPVTVLEELDRNKSGNNNKAFECRQAIRLIDRLIGDSKHEEITQGVPILRADGQSLGSLSIVVPDEEWLVGGKLSEHLNDNTIINCALGIQEKQPQNRVILVTKDINMRIKAKSVGLETQDYHNDQLVDDVDRLRSGYYQYDGVFWDNFDDVKTKRDDENTEGYVDFILNFVAVKDTLGIDDLYPNEYIFDSGDFAGRVVNVQGDSVCIRHVNKDMLMHREVWGLQPLDIQQAMALDLLMDPDISLVTLVGAAGSGKTILALAAAIEMVIENKRYNKIIATRSTPALAEDHGFLPGTEEEKMNPWLGAISDNIEALHDSDENPAASIEYVKERANIQFKAMNYIRGRSFQHSMILIDECQNLTPHQVKAIITRAGEGSKVVCLGNLLQIDTPYLNSLSSGLTFLSERFKHFPHGGHVALKGIPRSVLAQYASEHL